MHLSAAGSSWKLESFPSRRPSSACLLPPLALCPSLSSTRQLPEHAVAAVAGSGSAWPGVSMPLVASLGAHGPMQRHVARSSSGASSLLDGVPAAQQLHQQHQGLRLVTCAAAGGQRAGGGSGEQGQCNPQGDKEQEELQRKLPTLPEVFRGAAALAAATKGADQVSRKQAGEAAGLMYALGKQVQNGSWRKLPVGDQQAIPACVQQLQQVLLGEQQAAAAADGRGDSSSGAVPVLQALPAKDLSLCAWALGEVAGVRGLDPMPLWQALVQQAALSPAMAAAGWFEWSVSLRAVASVAAAQRTPITCCSHPGLAALFDYAARLLPGKLQARGSSPQNIAGVLWAFAKVGFSSPAGYSTPYLPPLIAALSQGVAAGWLMPVQGEGIKQQDVVDAKLYAKPQEWANTLYSLAQLGVYDEVLVGAGAAAMVQLTTHPALIAQNVANALWALSKLGWYERTTYNALLTALLGQDRITPVDFTNAVVACGAAGHLSPQVQQLAQAIQQQDLSRPQGPGAWGAWGPQELANSLLAWAELRAKTAAGTATHGGAAAASQDGPLGAGSPELLQALDSMGQALMREEQRRFAQATSDSGQKTKGLSQQELAQVHQAHLVASAVGAVGVGLPAGSPLLKQSRQVWVSAGEAFSKAIQSTPWPVQQSLLQAVQKSGENKLDVRLGALLQDGQCLVDLMVVQPNAFPKGLAFLTLPASDSFRQPAGRLSGRAAVRALLTSQECSAVIMVPTVEWDALDEGKQAQWLELELSQAMFWVMFGPRGVAMGMPGAR